MTDLRTRMRVFDQVPTPDYWADAEGRASTAPLAFPSARRVRPALLLVAVLSAVLTISAAVAIGSGLIDLPVIVPVLPSPYQTTPPEEPSEDLGIVHLLRGELIQRGGLMECDFLDGDPIVIFDGNGDVVATGVVAHPGGWSWGGGGPGPGWHVTHFEIEDVPERTFYTIESGDLVNQSFSFADLADADWTVELEVPCGLRGR